MEWIETTGASLDEAKERALDRLGVAEDDLEVEVLAEPSRTMFGLKKSEARLRARVRPHARPALAVLPHAVEHGGAVLLSEILGLARVFAPVRPRVPHPRAVPVEADERGVLVQRHVLRHEGIVRILVEIPRARRRVVVARAGPMQSVHRRHKTPPVRR